VSGGVKPETEIASIDTMNVLSENPRDRLPNQVKNQYRTVYFGGNRNFIYTRDRSRMIRGPQRER